MKAIAGGGFGWQAGAMRWLWGLLWCLAGPGWAESPAADCVALADRGAEVVPVRLAPLAEGVVRLRYIGHAMFGLRTSGGMLVVTDYNGAIGGASVVPDVVTMNNYHDSHYTDQPDPRIPLVLRGWGVPGLPAAIDLDLGELRIRNVTSDLRGPFGEGARADGNSIFVFEVAGLCIGHLGHLHQKLSPSQLGRIGRLDVVMVPVDGEYTMSQAAMAEVVRALHPRIVLPMHWFSDTTLERFLADIAADHTLRRSASAEIEVSRRALPGRPEVVVLTPQPFP